jgi:hypothetical protein
MGKIKKQTEFWKWVQNQEFPKGFDLTNKEHIAILQSCWDSSRFIAISQCESDYINRIRD